MEHEQGDEFIRRIANYIRVHEPGLAAATLVRRRRTKAASESNILNPLSWFTYDSTAAPQAVKPVILSFDAHHLFYLLMRLEALGFDVGSLDVRVDSPSRPMNYINVFPSSDRSDALSLASFRSSLSAVSRLSLGTGWWGRPAPPSVDTELKYIYSSFTKLPALKLHAPEVRLIAELANEAANENALPMDVFKNLQTLQCVDIDPRALMGWDRLAESLRSLTIKNSGLEDVSDIFIGAVLDDIVRRQGLASDSRARRTRGLPRQTSFSSTRLPETVPEDAEAESDDSPTSSAEDTSKPSTPTEMPSFKWAFLRHLSLADNALTFLPTTPLTYLNKLTHLDLSSNLLVSVPSGLSSLYHLISLNLSDNMIDSVLGIYTILGQVLHLNLSHNRLESICGLERLLALERVDLRNNLIEESAEVGRLAVLPNISQIWIEGNPLTEIEEGYRIRCFDLFLKEGKNILLDDTPPGMYERMYLSSPPPDQMSSARPPSIAVSPPVVAVGSPICTDASSPSNSPLETPISPLSAASYAPSPQDAALGRSKRRKNKRIVDFDGPASEASTSRDAPQARAPRAERTLSPRRADKQPEMPRGAATPRAGPSSAQDPQPSVPTLVAPVARPALKSRHSRHGTEFSHGAGGLPDDALASLSISPRGGSLRKSGTMSKSAARRSRVTASMYDPAEGDVGGEADRFKDAEAFRARIEALRSDMGEGWLKVLQQTQIGSPAVQSR
ncbi:L domain-like protein [Wolfiporia cocos MD-104 SS10]|uniref:L domain-like protein n=1 Tax=Wolfiporia cocos (strain MD-104) TaxID=742152 RepID=A0A2H3JJK7_WOLCO|nr:L domain-like protein [Wolfiporia cocos MD-104 SS10]